MKKVFSVIVAGALLSLLCLSASAFYYEKDGFFTVEIPDGYSQVEEGMFKAEDGSTFSVSYEDNAELCYSVADMSEARLRKAAQEMAVQAKDVFASLGKNAEMELVSLEKAKHKNGMNVVVSVFKTTADSNGESVTRYQKVYEFAGEQNKYTFTYTPSDESKLNNMDSAFSSIVINEDEATFIADKLLSGVASAGLVALVLFGILRFFRKPKRK